MPADVRHVLEQLMRSPARPAGRIEDLCVAHRVAPATPAVFAPLPEGLHPALVPALESRGIGQLYSHQRLAYDQVTGASGGDASRNTVVVTPTASGKTLCYNLPVLDALLKDPGARALYLFPTKALSRDQAAELLELMEVARGEPGGTALGTAVYDGDTPPSERRTVRDRAHVVMSNPDMLHAAILPHHARWMRLFENLRYVVIDELHTYRGVFGSHLANVLRRLRRICRFHGSDPVFISTSATIANAKQFSERLLEQPVSLIEQNGAPLGERHFVMLNPPVVNPALGLRGSYLTLARQVARHFLRAHVHSIIFCGSRTTTEVMTKYLKDMFRPKAADRPQVVGYRGGYLPRERRAIERGLRDGSILGVVSTNALELGIDIGALDACVIAGYPGTVASTRQQAGRAGRRQTASAAVMVLRSHPLDQYLADHPEHLLDASPESAQINPDNLQVFVSHLKCAAFELPIEDGEWLAASEEGREVQPGLLDYLGEVGVLRHTGGRWHWCEDTYPATDLSLRSVTSTNFVIVDTTGNQNQVIAEVDYSWAFTTIHEGAIYMVQSTQYHVDKLDWERRKAFVRKVESEYYTDAQSYVKVKILHELRGPAPAPAVAAEYGEVEVIRKAIGYKKIKFYTHENLGWGDILLPEDIYHTQATWFTVPDAVVRALAVPTSDLIDGLHGIANLAHSLAAMLLMCDGRDMGVVIGDRGQEWFLRPSAPGALKPEVPPEKFEPTIFLYDQYSGGIGLAEALHPRVTELLESARTRLGGCSCKVGCPACVGPDQEVGPRAKEIALALLDGLLAHASQGELVAQ
jgi:DEAD/DEAH box helicase domain-containing protein